MRIRREWVQGTAFAAGCLLVSTAAALQPTPVSFPAADGLQIAADYYAPPVANRGSAPIVILLHDAGGDRQAWRRLVAPLHEAGFAVLAPDLRGHGETATTATRDAAHDRDPALFQAMQADLRGAYDWLAQQPQVDRARFTLVGVGAGGSVALQYAAKDRSVDAVICLSPALNQAGLDSAGDIHQVTGRKILLFATEDGRDAPYTLQQRNPAAEVRILRGAKTQGTELLAEVRGLDEQLVAQLSSGAGEPTLTVVYGSVESNIYHGPESGWLAKIAPTNLRYYSSPQEAEARGLRPARSKGPAAGRGGGPRRQP